MFLNGKFWEFVAKRRIFLWINLGNTPPKAAIFLKEKLGNTPRSGDFFKKLGTKSVNLGFKAPGHTSEELGGEVYFPPPKRWIRWISEISSPKTIKNIAFVQNFAKFFKMKSNFFRASGKWFFSAKKSSRSKFFDQFWAIRYLWAVWMPLLALAFIITRLDPRGMSPPGRALPNEKPARFARNSFISKLLWGPPEHADIFCSKIEKVTKKMGPRNRAHRLEFAKVAGPPFGHSGNKPNGICVWSRSICYSVNLR